jgi:signal transduction histidine kinase
VNDADEVLTRRSFQLESGNQKGARQEGRFKTAYDINQLIRGDLDFARMVDAAAHAFVSEGGFLAARVSVKIELNGRIFQRTTEEGETMEGPSLAQLLEWRGRTIGRVQVWYQAEEDSEELRDLLAVIVPTISIALDDAITYTALVERTRELGEARDGLTATVQKLKHAEEARNRIFANINHDVRTPLSTIMMSTSDLRRHMGDRLDSRANAALTRTDQSVNKLLRLIDGLLLLAAGEEDKLALRIEVCDVGALLNGLLATWGLAAKEHGLAFEYRGPSQLEVMVDEQALERMVANLISNAIKFTPTGGRIEVSVFEHDGGVEISVRDTGIGIDEEFKTRIFGRFEQGRPSVRPGMSGSGIGLSIVKELAEAHEGWVDVETPDGGGSRFRIWLPLEAPAPLAARTAAPRQSDRVSPVRVLQSDNVLPARYGLDPLHRSMTLEVTGPKGAATVLVAEDDPELRGALTELLSTEYRVLVAADGLSALRLAERHSPDLLVSDIGMPGIDGLELTRRFRSLPENRLSPVLLLSAYGELGNRLLGFDAGAVDYITKPFAPEELLAHVRALLAFRSMALRLHGSEQLAALGALSVGLAHEMRNPANAIVNAVEPLVELLPKELLHKDEPVEQLVSVLRDCAGQIGLLSRQLLGFKRPGAVEREEHHVTTLLQRCITLALPLLREVDLRLDFKYDRTARMAVPLMIQVMTNLLENAAQAAGAGGWVGLATRAEGDKLIIEVSDSGPGVPATLRDRVFEPFFTTKPPGLGSGLGLPTSREIAIRHGGTLEVRETNTGSLFRLELPLQDTRNGIAAALENASP